MRAIAFVVAMLGVALSLVNCLAVIGSVGAGISAARTLMRTSADPAQLGAVIGETLIAIASHGFLAIIPASLLYAALVGFRVRSAWFFSCARGAAIYFLFVPPFATVFGIILLVALSRRRPEFAAAAKDL